MSVKITFLGASGTVTGSKYLVEGAGKKILVDCGIFQGPREWTELNWEAPPFNPDEIDAVLITHAHIDHTGMLPRYHSLGLKAPIYCSKTTMELSGLLLPDSGALQEERTEYLSQRNLSRHAAPLPLYTEKDAISVLKLFVPIQIDQEVEILPGIKATWKLMGHILGACSITLKIGGKVINFSGDIGRYSVPILKDPVSLELGDLLLIESTYGDKLHENDDPSHDLELIIKKTLRRKGTVVIPSFAVGRAQQLLYYIRELKEQGRIPDVPVIVDSPMARDATSLYAQNSAEYDPELLAKIKKGVLPFKAGTTHFIRDRSESIRLNSIDDSMIIISASGMLSGGRILHHLLHRISDPRNTILFVGHQPTGGKGSYLLGGYKTVRLFKKDIFVRAEIANISGLSAHGDKGELLRWAKECTGKPGKVAVVHGEPDTASVFSDTLRAELGWDTFVAAYKQTIEV